MDFNQCHALVNARDEKIAPSMKNIKGTHIISSGIFLSCMIALHCFHYL